MKFIIVENHEIVSHHKLTYKELDSDVEQVLEYKELSPTYYQTKNKLPDGVVQVRKMKDWQLECVCELESYEIMSYYGDFDYWCVEINGVMYESTNSDSTKPEWATHYSYYLNNVYC